MILIFDLDDTLYSEHTYVVSGFRAVANMLQKEASIPAKDSLSFMLHVLEQQGRGHVFDALLKKNNCMSAAMVRHCVTTYRLHKPDISLSKETLSLLTTLHRKPYLVTDGHKIVQKNKIDSLHLAKYLEKYYITHRYGVQHAKPSLYCFDLIRKKEKVDWSDLVYVGDNPQKDFINLNQVGAMTIRVNAGMYGNTVAKQGYDAKYSITKLTELPVLFDQLNIKSIFKSK